MDMLQGEVDKFYRRRNPFWRRMTDSIYRNEAATASIGVFHARHTPAAFAHPGKTSRSVLFSRSGQSPSGYRQSDTSSASWIT